jgi:CheY-like chemotaxis protein
LIPNGTTGTNEVWSHVSHDALWRTVDLAQRVLHCTTALVSSFTAGARIVRATAGDDSRLPISAFCHRVIAEGAPFASDAGSVLSTSSLDDPSSVLAYFGVPLRLSDGRMIGTLCVADVPSRLWSDDDRMLLAALAAHLLTLIDGMSTPVDTPLQAISKSASIPVQPVDAVLKAETAPTARILLADDLDLNRRLIADMLAIEGHVVDSVVDGAAALAAASTKAYDLILMDMIMPGMDGIEATRAIRALPGPAGRVPIVALTANSYPEQLESCIAAGMNATLTKPMSLDALIQAVETWLRAGDTPPLPSVEPS